MVAGSRRFAIREVEAYLYGPGHEDPFAHQHPNQGTSGRWHFHRQGRSYRGGTFKGLDLTFGPPETRAGLLLRALSETAGDAPGDGVSAEVSASTGSGGGGPKREDVAAGVSGPCRVVHTLLEATGQATVAALDAELGSALDPDTPLHLVARPWAGSHRIYASARVGLGLAREASHPTMREFLGLRLRWLDAPHIREGRDLLTVALHEDGWAPEEISARLRTPLRTVRARIEAWSRGYAGGWAATPGAHQGCAQLGAFARAMASRGTGEDQ